jgi:tetratricopeptide (TPR) repeat protein
MQVDIWEILTIIGVSASVIGVLLVLYFRRKDTKASGELRGMLEDFSKKVDGISLYIDGLPEIREKKRQDSLRSGLKSMQNYKYDEAITFFRECLGAEATQSQKVALLILIGNCFLSQSHLKEAEGHYREAEVIAKESNDKEGLSSALGNMGIVYGRKGELDKALEQFQLALKINREIGDREGEAKSLGSMGNVYLIKGELDKALGYFQPALKIHREIGDRQGEAGTLSNMGIVYRIKGELDKALEHHQQALKIFEEIGAAEGIEKTRRNIKELGRG